MIWEVGLGELKNGKPAGSIAMRSDVITANTYQPAGLVFESESGEIATVRDGHGLRQVWAPKALADVVRLGDRAYEIRFYESWRVSGPAGGPYAVNDVDAWHVKYLIDSPDPSGFDRLRIRKTVRLEGDREWTTLLVAPPGGTTWELDDWHRSGTAAPRRESRTFGVENGKPVETVVVRNEANVEATTTKLFYYVPPWGGRELERRIDGWHASGDALHPRLETRYVYHENPAQGGNYGKVKAILYPDGSWIRYDYFDDEERLGLPRFKSEPYLSEAVAEATILGDLSAARVRKTEYDYAYDQNARRSRKSSEIVTQPDGSNLAHTRVTVGRSELSYMSETKWVLSLATAQPVLVETRHDYANNDASYTTVTKRFREDSDLSHHYTPHGSSQRTYQHDHAGNRTLFSESNALAGASPNARNEYGHFGTYGQTWEAGRLTQDGRADYGYDSHNRLVSWTSSGITVANTYDYAGRRIQKVVTLPAGATTVPGLKAEYFQNQTWYGTPVLTRVEETVDLQWGTGTPAQALAADNFSVRWSGRIHVPTTGDWTFSTVTDDGMELWINGVRWLHDPHYHGDWENSVTIPLGAGFHTIEMKMFEGTLGATARLFWQGPGMPKQIIRAEHLSCHPPGAPALAQTHTTRYLYDGWKLVAELDGAGSLLRTFTWAEPEIDALGAVGGQGALLAIQEAGTTYFPIYDGTGNTIGIVDSGTGVLVAAYSYDPFGNLIVQWGDYAAKNPFGFKGQYTDRESGLIQHGHRTYSPRMGRFIQRDPLGEAGGLNLYAYAENDPIKASGKRPAERVRLWGLGFVALDQ